MVQVELPQGPCAPGNITEEDIRHYAEAMASPGALTATTNYYRALFRRTPAQNRRLLRKVEAPVMVIWGEKDRYLGAELAEPETSWVANVRVERLLNASHWVHQDDFRKVNALLLDFLRAPKGAALRRDVNSSMSDPTAGLNIDDPPASAE